METHLDKPCDICGDVGFDDALATCSQCNIAHEHALLPVHSTPQCECSNCILGGLIYLYLYGPNGGLNHNVVSYCMRIVLTEVPDNWLCESCRLIQASQKNGKKEHFPEALAPNLGIIHCDTTHSVGTRKLLDGSAWQNNNKRQKMVESAKVKFISTKEVIMLSSGIQKGEGTVWSDPSKSPRPSIITPSMSKRTFTGSKTATPKFSQSKVKENPSSEPPGFSKTPRQNCEKQASQPSKQFKEAKTVVPSAMENHRRERPIEALNPNNESETSITKVEKPTNKTSCVSSPSTHCLPSVSSGDKFYADAELRNSNVEKNTLLNILSALKNCILNPPNVDATWNGSIEILGSAMTGKPYDGFWLGKPYVGFQAHPPFKVHKKAYEFSKRMPPVLQFELLPRCNLWANIFKDDYPDEDDIALYIVPGDFERSKLDYVCLLEILDVDDLVMGSLMDGVELLVFTSKQLQLHVDSQKFNMKYFLWGVFRSLKHKRPVTKGLAFLVSPLEHTHDDHGNEDNSEHGNMEIDMIGGKDVGSIDVAVPLECTHDDHANEDNSEHSDMEIDMMGGKDVGSIDVAVPKESIRSVFGSSWAEKSKGKIPTDTGNFCSTTQQPLYEVKREQCNEDVSYGVTQKVKSEFALEGRFQSSQKKLSNTNNKLGFPPGFKLIFKQEK